MDNIWDRADVLVTHWINGNRVQVLETIKGMTPWEACATGIRFKERLATGMGIGDLERMLVLAIRKGD